MDRRMMLAESMGRRHVMKRRRVHSIRAELVTKSREAALSAVQTFNNPLTQFKSEAFIVLMIIAWTYLLHAYYRREGVEYRYHSRPGQRRRFDRTRRGSYRFWDLERCLNDEQCPVDGHTKNNLKFLIGLRHEIEHQMTLRLDNYLSSRYQACCLNYNYYVKDLFGGRYGLDAHLTYSLQLVELARDQVDLLAAAEEIPRRVKAYIADFDGALTEEEFNSPRYSYRLLFTQKLTGKVGQADQVVEFVSPSAEVAQQIDKQYWVQKEVEKPKYLRKEILGLVHSEGYVGFGGYQHTRLWKALDAKNPGRGYGVEIGGIWYWYERWVEVVREHCRGNAESYQDPHVTETEKS
jgi:hypothetical protein